MRALDPSRRGYFCLRGHCFRARAPLKIIVSAWTHNWPGDRLHVFSFRVVRRFTEEGQHE